MAITIDTLGKRSHKLIAKLARLLLATVIAVGLHGAPGHAQVVGPTVGTPCSKLGATQMNATGTDILACLYSPAPTLLWVSYGAAHYTAAQNTCAGASQCVVLCPTGSLTATGGGCAIGAGAGAQLTITAPTPANDGWNCVSNSVPGALTLTAYVLCVGP